VYEISTERVNLKLNCFKLCSGKVSLLSKTLKLYKYEYNIKIINEFSFEVKYVFVMTVIP
jgi:hypothetical protein